MHSYLQLSFFSQFLFKLITCNIHAVTAVENELNTPLSICFNILAFRKCFSLFLGFEFYQSIKCCRNKAKRLNLYIPIPISLPRVIWCTWAGILCGGLGKLKWSMVSRFFTYGQSSFNVSAHIHESLVPACFGTSLQTELVEIKLFSYFQIIMGMLKTIPFL